MIETNRTVMRNNDLRTRKGREGIVRGLNYKILAIRHTMEFSVLIRGHAKVSLGNAVQWLGTTALESEVDITHLPTGVPVLLPRVFSLCWGLMGTGADASRHQGGGQMALTGGFLGLAQPAR